MLTNCWNFASRVQSNPEPFPLVGSILFVRMIIYLRKYLGKLLATKPFTDYSGDLHNSNNIALLWRDQITLFTANQIIKSLLLLLHVFLSHNHLHASKCIKMHQNATLTAPHQSRPSILHLTFQVHQSFSQSFSQSWPPLLCILHTILRNSAETSGVDMQISALSLLPPPRLLFRHRSLHQLPFNPCLHPRNSFASLIQRASPFDERELKVGSVVFTDGSQSLPSVPALSEEIDSWTGIDIHTDDLKKTAIITVEICDLA